MNRSELIERLAMRHSQLKPQEVEDAVKHILEKISASLASGNRVEIRDFGSFSVHHREARTGRNPKTGTPVKVPPKYIPYFRAGKELRERVDASSSHKK